MEHMKGLLKEFETFAMRGNALELAVGVIIGAAFNQVVTALTNNVLTPPLGLLLGNVDLADFAVRIIGTGVVIKYGVFLQALINFVITAFALFLFLKGFNRLARRREEEEKAEEKKPEENPELKVLMEIRDELKNRA